MCSICGQPSFIRCNCQSSQPFCDQCAEDSVCLDKIDSSCVIYHFGNPTLPSRLINLNLPNGSSAQTIFEAIDSALGTAGSGPISITNTEAIHILADGPGNRHLTPSLILSQQSGNTAVINPDGLYVPLPANLYKVQVDSGHIPYFLEDALIGGTDGIVSLSFEPLNGILFGIPLLNMTALVNAIINNPTLITTLTSSVINAIINNPTFLTALTTAIENKILNDPTFIHNLIQAILNDPSSKALLCSSLNSCHFDCNCSGGTACNAPLITGAGSTLESSGGTTTLSVGYTDASPLPTGYLIFYRPAGTFGSYTSAGPFPPSSSPITIHGLVPGNYEGYVQSVCSGGSFSSGATFVTNNFYSVRVTNTLANLSITGVNNISGFTFLGPVNVGGNATGIHNAFTATIQVVTTGSTLFAGNFTLVRNGITIDCINIPGLNTPGTKTFGSHTFAANDLIEIELNTGAC